MATIGIYHMDLWHTLNKAVPNLEAIKIYNYFLNKGDQVLMIGPNDELQRFNYIYFIKDSPTPLGKEASSKLAIENKKLMGYGFFGKVDKLKPEIFNQKLNYACYDKLLYRITNKGDYNNMAKNSLIRVETEDFTDYKPDRNLIFIADNNPTAITAMPDFLLEHKNNHQFKFLFPLRVNSDNIDKFARFESLIKGTLVCNDFTSQTYKEYCYDKHIVFNYERRGNESDNHYIARLLAMGIIIKSYQSTPSIGVNRYSENGIAKSIYQWILQKDWSPFITYYSDNKDIQNYILNAPSEIRLLCKTKPLAINSSTFDLQSYF